MVIGLIGGVGSGKSTVLNYLKEKYRAYIIEADKVAKEIMQPGTNVYNEVGCQFPDCMDMNGQLNRQKLAEIVFNDNVRLQKLNAITHPGTIDEIKRQIIENKNKMVVVESAILIGTGIENLCDEIWCVHCDREIRVKRLMENRGYTREKSLTIMENQMSEEEQNQVSDAWIDNSKTNQETKEQIDFIINSHFF